MGVHSSPADEPAGDPGGVILARFGTGSLKQQQGANPEALFAAGALLLPAGSLWLYLRFGFLSVAALCAVPFQLSLPPAVLPGDLRARLPGPGPGPLRAGSTAAGAERRAAPEAKSPRGPPADQVL